MSFQLHQSDVIEIGLPESFPSTFWDQVSFNTLCRQMASHLATTPLNSSTADPQFSDLISRIEGGGDDIIKTGWGGVVIERHEPPLVEKYLVVRAQNYLAFEKHELKVESLFPRSGTGVLLHKTGDHDVVRVLPLTPGHQFDLAPGEEHCIIAGSDLVVFERSLDHKGMDQDLIFLFTPDESS